MRPCDAGECCTERRRVDPIFGRNDIFPVCRNIDDFVQGYAIYNRVVWQFWSGVDTAAISRNSTCEKYFIFCPIHAPWLPRSFIRERVTTINTDLAGKIYKWRTYPSSINMDISNDASTSWIFTALKFLGSCPVKLCKMLPLLSVSVLVRPP